MQGMTKRQKEVLDFVKAYTVDNEGVAPSYQEIADGIGLKSKSGVHRLVWGLIERGLIAMPPTAGHYAKKRSLAPSEPPQRLVDCVAVLVGMARFGLDVTDAMIRDTLRAA